MLRPGSARLDNKQCKSNIMFAPSVVEEILMVVVRSAALEKISATASATPRQ
jgi:hypothetical protein